MLFLISTNSDANSIFNKTTWGVLLYYVVKTIVSGPLGEELGWRGFALMELQKKYSPLKSSIIIGFGGECGICLYGLLQVLQAVI